MNNVSTINETYDVGGVPENLHFILNVIYAIIATVGITGNSMVILVIFKDRKMRSVPNIFLISLSAADLMIIVFCLPVPVYELYSANNWIFGSFICKMASYLQYLTVNASILTIVAISFERLFVICVPLKAKKYCTKRRTVSAIGFIWVICSISSFPIFLFTVIYEAHDNVTGASITACITPTQGHEWYLLFEIAAFYICPGVILLVIYALITKSLHSYNLFNEVFQARPNNNSRRVSGRRESRKQLIAMLLAVVIAYFICLLPFNVIVILAVLSPDKLTNMDETNYTIVLSVTRVLFFLNSCVDPILYSAISRKFRTAYLRLFQCTANQKSSTESEYLSLMRSSMKFANNRKIGITDIALNESDLCC